MYTPTKNTAPPIEIDVCFDRDRSYYIITVVVWWERSK